MEVAVRALAMEFSEEAASNLLEAVPAMLSQEVKAEVLDHLHPKVAGLSVGVMEAQDPLAVQAQLLEDLQTPLA